MRTFIWVVAILTSAAFAAQAWLIGSPSHWAFVWPLLWAFGLHSAKVKEKKT